MNNNNDRRYDERQNDEEFQVDNSNNEFVHQQQLKQLEADEDEENNLRIYQQQQNKKQQQQQDDPLENPYHFQTKIHNSGFWGDDRRRRGTWLVAIGAIFISISIVLIAVFWRWWYGPEINVPCRIVAITLLIFGLFCIVIGLLSNALMEMNRESKHFLGSPPRWSSWILLIGLLFIIIAADFMTFYYSYWHTRFINTPFIISSIILFFFGTIFIGVGLHYNIKAMRIRYQLVAREFK